MPRLRTRIVPRGGSSLPALTAPTPPTQGPPSAQGTASVSLTWTHPGAPASGITYTLVATDLSDGSAVTPSSGSGLGPYVLPMTDGRQVICTLVVTRTADSQSVPSATYLASVESGASTPGWEDLPAVDLTGLTSQTLPGDQTSVNVTRAAGGAVVASVWSHQITNTGTAVAGSTGIVVDGVGAGGSMTAILDAEALFSLSLPDDLSNGLAISMHMTGVGGLGTSSNAIQVGATVTQARPTTGSSNTVQLIGATGTNVHDRKFGTNNTFTDWSLSQANPTDWIVTLLFLGDTMFAFYGTSEPSDAALDALTGAAKFSATIAASATAASSLRYGSTLYLAVCAQLNGGPTTLTRITARRRVIA